MNTPAHENSQDPESVVRDHTGRMLLLLTMGLATAKLGQYLLPPLLPAVIDTLSITPVRAGIALSTLSLFYGLTQYLGGRYADQLSRKTILVLAYCFILLGYLVLSQTTTYGILLVGATIVGTGMGLYGPADRALVSDLFHRRRGLALGINVTGTELSGAIGAGLATIALATYGWRAAFAVLLPLGGVILYLLHRWGREPYVHRLAGLELQKTINRLGTVQYLPLVLVYVLFIFIGQGFIGFLPTLLQVDHGFTPTAASLTYASVFVAGLVAKPIAGRVSDRINRLTVTIGAFGLGLIGLLVLVGATGLFTAVFGTVLFAVGHRSFPPVMQAHLLDSFPAETMAGDLGAIRTVYIALGGLGPTYVGVVASRWNYTTAYAGLAVGFVIAMAILVWYRTYAAPAYRS